MFDLPAVSLARTELTQQLRALKSNDSLVLSYDNAVYHAPRSLDELTRLRSEHPEATLVAGCTDVGLWVNKQFRDLGDIVYLGDINELKKIKCK